MRKAKTIRRALACFVCVLAIYSGAVYAQNDYAYAGNRHKSFVHQTGDLPKNDQKQKLLTVLKQLNETKGVYFLYSEQALGSKMVNPIEASEEDVEKILTQVLKNTGLKFKKINDKTFVILSKDNSNSKSGAAAKSATFNVQSETLSGATSVNVPVDIISGKVI